MSVSITGQSVYSGSIFYYDTYNVKSYVGEPTTNRNQQISNYTGTNYADGTEWSSDPTRFSKTYTASIATPIGFGATLCSETATAGYYHLSSMGGGSESGEHSISCYIYPLSSITNFTIGMLNDGGNMVTFDFTTGAITYGGSIENRNAFMSTVVGFPGWYRVGANIEGRFGGWVGCVGLSTNTSYTPSAPYKSFYITGLQYEYKNHCTPYVFGTRSNTQGLLDLVGTSTLELTNAGYNTSGSITFNGSSNYIIASENPAFNTQTPSVEVWIKTNNTNQNGFWFEKGNVNTQYSLFQEGTVIQWRQNIGGVTNLSTTTATYISTANWAHVVGTYTSGARKLYIDGVLVNSDNQSGTINTNTNGISMGVYGGYNGARGYYYNGLIGMVRVYNRVLSADEVLRNYNISKARYGR